MELRAKPEESRCSRAGAGSTKQGQGGLIPIPSPPNKARCHLNGSGSHPRRGARRSPACRLLPIPPAAYPARVYKCWKLRAGPKFPPRQQLLCEFYTQAPRDPGEMEEPPLDGESAGAAGGTCPQNHSHRIPPSSSPKGISVNLPFMSPSPFLI